MFEGHKIAVVVPCYKEKANILDTLANIPADVDLIYCVDDGCPEGTGTLVSEESNDARVRVLTHAVNQGVGAAVCTGYRQALEDGADIIVKMDGDGQMDPALMPQLLRPILKHEADYVKGNRFFFLSDLERMPAARIIGNSILSFMSKLSAGYWRIFDPTNGYTAIHAKALSLLQLDKLHKGYFFESDMLYRLATIRAVVRDVPHSARYRDEVSGISLLKVVPLFTLKHLRNFLSRIFYTYFLRDFHLASLEWVFGPVLFLFGVSFGIVKWIELSALGVEASAGTVMLSALPAIVGLQLLLSAIGFDIDNQPQFPIHEPKIIE